MEPMERDIRAVGHAIEVYLSDHHGQYPPSLDVLVDEDYAQPLAGGLWEGRRLVYRPPDLGVPPKEVLAYSWPPYQGRAILLFPYGVLLTQSTEKGGLLRNPRTNVFIRTEDTSRR
jgi:hypothetical protein